MARTRTRLQMRSEIRQLTDTESSTHVTDATINDWLDQDLAALWQKMVSSDPHWFRQQVDIVTTAGTREYGPAGGFPAAFHSHLGLDFVRGDELYPIQEYKFQERTFGPDYYVDAFGIPNTRYEIAGNGVAGADVRLRFDRDPGANTYRLYYVQAPQTTLADDTATFDGVGAWEEWAIRSVCIRVCGKEDMDPSIHVMERENKSKEISVAAAKRNQSSPGRIQDVTSRSVDYYSRRI